MTEHLLLRLASHAPGETALVCGDHRLTYGELLCASDGLCGRLADDGIGSDAAVCICMSNSLEAVVAIMACARLGVASLLLDPGLKASEVAAYCGRAHAAPVLCVESVGQLLAAAGIPVVLVRPPASLIGGSGTLVRPTSSAPVFLLVSSGTAGAPKIVVRTAAQMDAAIEIFQGTIPLQSTDRVLATLPFFHSFGLTSLLSCSLSAGAQVHIAPFSPRATVATIEEARITVLPASPFMLRLLTETCFATSQDLSSLRLVISVGSALPVGVARRLREICGAEILESYGCTEAASIAVGQAGTGDSGGLIGRPYRGVTIDVRGGAPNALERTAGPIAVCSPANASSYLDEPEATAKVFVDGWVLTGDLGAQDERGNLLLLGREKPMVSVAGKKVSPTEVEACLRAHPCVADVVVGGVRADDGEERLTAAVVASGPVTALELRQFCTARLAEFKAPRRFVFVDDLSQGPLHKPTEGLW